MEDQSQSPIAQPGAPAPEVAAEAKSPEVPSPERATQYYFDVIGTLVDGAEDGKRRGSLVNVMTWYLARIVVDCGTPAAGDVLERLGTHMNYFLERDRAAKEGAEAREAGRLPH